MTHISAIQNCNLVLYFGISVPEVNLATIDLSVGDFVDKVASN